VLLLGASGLVGSHLREALRDRDVVATYHARAADGAVPLDITDHTATRDLIGRTRPDVTILAAADPYVERCERDPAGTRRINVDAARAIADAARDVGSALVVFSSEYVFDGTAGPYDEDRPTGPINEYGRQKVELEAIARSVDHHLVCRTSGVFGSEAARKNFVCQLVDRLRAGDTFDVPNDQQITPTYAPALARGVRALIDREAWGTVHTVGPRIFPRLEFAEMVARAFALPDRSIRGRPTSELGSIAARPRAAGLSDAKLRRLVGPLTDPAEGLREMAASGP
jgi:dTDP-4-dehydrorhamnose reductase